MKHRSSGASFASFGLGFVIGRGSIARDRSPSLIRGGQVLSWRTRCLLLQADQRARWQASRTPLSGQPAILFIIVQSSSALAEELVACHWAHRVRQGVMLHLGFGQPDRARQIVYVQSILRSLAPVLGDTLIVERKA